MAARWSTRVLIGLLIGLTLALTPVAYADPPDDTWIGGFWDDDDFDTVVIAIVSTVALPQQGSFDQVAPTLLVVGTVTEPAAVRALSAADSQHQPRSPPLTRTV